MRFSRKIGLAVAALCIMALMVTAASAAGTPGPVGPGGKNNPVPRTNGIQAYTMSQTISDQAQMMTIAFDALAFMTGDSCSDTFLPPGKVADYAGFQYLRDNDKTQMGHNTDFVTRTADNVLITLNDEQLANFVTLSKEESTLSDHYGLMRFPLTTAFREQYAGTTPAGSSGLDKAAVMTYSGKLYDVDASISIARAKTYASVINSLNPTQRAYLDTMKSGGLLSYPVVDASEVLKNSGQGNSVAMRTYASEMFAWYAGSVDADVYFCPERQATYFGSFYMKDAPAMGNAGYSISTTLTGDSGETFLSYLTDAQREKITSLVDIQRADLNEIVSTRKAIATELRRPLTGGTIDENLVRTLSARYGALDGEISYFYATHFADVGKTLTSEQKAKMVALRNLAGYTCNGAYLYSQPISMPQNIPSEFLFGKGSYDGSAVSSWIENQQQISGTSEPGTGKQGLMPGNATRQGLGYDLRSGNATRPALKNTSWAGKNTQQEGKPGPDNPADGPSLPARDRTINPGTTGGIPGWFISLWQSLWAGSEQKPSPCPSPSQTVPQTKPRPTRQPGGARQDPVPAGKSSGTFVFTSNAGTDGGMLPAEYSCDGAGSTPALSWSGAPDGTKEFALMMTTVPVDGSIRWNWVLYGIPGSTTGLEKDRSGVGITGTGSHGTVMQYDPPCPQGPGAKTYTFTLYALSEIPKLPISPEQVTGPVLTNAISSITLDKASFNRSYGRSS